MINQRSVHLKSFGDSSDTFEWNLLARLRPRSRVRARSRIFGFLDSPRNFAKRVTLAQNNLRLSRVGAAFRLHFRRRGKSTALYRLAPSELSSKAKFNIEKRPGR